MLTDATLLKSQRNTLLDILRGANFDPADFEWREEAVVEHNDQTWAVGGLESRVSKLIHVSTGYSIIFGRLKVMYSPGTTRKLEEEEHHDDWQRRYQSFRAWLSCLRKEVDTPDLWAIVAQERALSDAASSGLENRAFTELERAKVLEGIEELKSAVLAVKIYQTEQTDFIDGQFEYLRDSSGRLGRKDWINVAFSVMINLATNLALDPIKAQGILAIGGALFQWIWTGAQGLLAK
jgi:hypothetical protein